MPVNIYVLPLGDDIDHDVLEHIRRSIEDTIGPETTILDPQPVPEHTFSPYVHQFSAPSIVHQLAAAAEGPSSKVLGVTAFDLYAPRTNYVFGEAQMSGQVAVVSLYRLCERGRQLYFDRVAKEAVHELGHTFGLEHCDDPTCVMHFSHTITDTDLKTGEFCAKDKALLNEALGK